MKTCTRTSRLRQWVRVFTVLSIAAHEDGDISVGDITGAYLNDDMGTEAHDTAVRGLRKIRICTGLHIGEAAESKHIKYPRGSWIFEN